MHLAREPEAEVTCMTHTSDDIGMRYGALVVLSVAGRAKDSRKLLLCQCDCGNRKVIKQTALRRGYTLSCGCYRSELLAQRAKLLNEQTRQRSPVQITCVDCSVAFTRSPTDKRSTRCPDCGAKHSAKVKREYAKTHAHKKHYLVGRLPPWMYT